MNSYQLAQMIDHTALSADKNEQNIKLLCEQAKEFNFYSVCINPIYLELSQRLLSGSKVKLCTVIDFPLGASDAKAKALMTRQSISCGAQEVDMVIPIGILKSGQFDLVFDHIHAVVNEAKSLSAEVVTKVIIETALLSESEKAVCCELVSKAGAEFIKTSTGFSTSGAQLEDIKLFKKYLAPKVKIKASGGIGDFERAMSFVNAGVHRIGASKSVEIVLGASK